MAPEEEDCTMTQQSQKEREGGRRGSRSRKQRDHIFNLKHEAESKLEVGQGYEH